MSTPSHSRLPRKSFLFIALAALIVFAGMSRPFEVNVEGQSAPTACATCSQPTQQIIYTPLIDWKDASFAEINLNCRSPQPIDVVPTFYTDDGTPIVGETITLTPAEMRFIDVQSLIPAGHRGGHHWGGMTLAYTGRRFEVWGQMTFHGISNDDSVNSFFAIIDAPSSNVRNAVWKAAKNSTATIAIGNYSDTPALASLTFSNGDVEQLNVAPHGTEIITRKNNEHNATNIDAESVTITSYGQTGRLIPMGFVSSNNGDFGSSIRFADTENIAQPNLYSTNFRLKNTTPSIVLKNTTYNAITAHPRFLPVTGEGSGVVELSAVTISANSIKQLNLTPLTNAAASRQDLDSVSVQIINSGGNGSLIAAANFTNTTTGVDYDIPLRDSGLTRNSAGGYPVRLDGDYTTTLSITNVGDQPGTFTMQINFAGGPYAMYPHELAPGATAVFDLRKIRDQQIPDSSGRLLPPNLTLGQIKWSIIRGFSTRLIGRSEIISRTGKVSSSYSCGVSCGNSFYSGRVDPVIATGDIGDTVLFTAREIDADGYGNFQSEYGMAQSQVVWYSNPSIASISNGLALATAAGDSAIEADWTAPHWSEGPFGECHAGEVAAVAYADFIVRPPTATIDSFSAVGKGQTAKIRVVVSNNSNNKNILLTLSPASGTGTANFTSTNSATRTITSTTDVEITGVTESSTNNNMLISPTYNGSGAGSSRSFTVVRVDLSLNLSGSAALNNAGRNGYQAAIGSLQLGGPFLTAGNQPGFLVIGIEIVGMVYPSNYTGNIKIVRELISTSDYDETTAPPNTKGKCAPNNPPCDDTSPAEIRDDVPGTIYDLDSPGPPKNFTSTEGAIIRRRSNFRQWATVSQLDSHLTKDVRVSSDITWFNRTSIKIVNGAGQVLSDVSNDNQNGSGTTPLTRNLQ